MQNPTDAGGDEVRPELCFRPPDPSVQTSLNKDLLRESWFILPCNDGEALRSGQILAAAGATRLHISDQAWGATLDRELPHLNWQHAEGARRVVIFEIPGKHDRYGVSETENLFCREGLELVIIDHHTYHRVDRYCPESSLEQLCQLIGWQLSFAEQAIAVNDRSYIPGLKRLGLNRSEILAVRDFDYTAMGYHQAEIQEQRSRVPEALDYWKQRKRGALWVLEKPAVIRHFLLEELAVSAPDGIVNVLEISPDKLSFSGSPDVVRLLLDFDYRAFGPDSAYFCYSGGDPEGSRFWGFRPRHKSKKIPRSLIERLISDIRKITG
ncbi:MAG: hypothetical protein H6618_05980 [Deltaproteobacteria bacterium]|nr:hypothetical protein [Deltaproteobacteria bacterium]